MEKIVKKFSSFEAAEEADIDYWRSCPKDEKIKVLEFIRNSIWFKGNEPSERLQRVCRIIKLEES